MRNFSGLILPTLSGDKAVEFYVLDEEGARVRSMIVGTKDT